MRSCSALRRFTCSSNAASFFGASLKGRAKEPQYEDHKALDQTYAMDVPTAVSGGLPPWEKKDVPLRDAMNLTFVPISSAERQAEGCYESAHGTYNDPCFAKGWGATIRDYIAARLE